MIHSLNLDDKGNILSTSQYNTEPDSISKNSIVIPKSVHDIVFTGMREGKSFKYVSGDVIEDTRKPSANIDGAVLRIDKLVQDSLENFVFVGVGNRLTLSVYEREHALISLQLNIPFVARCGTHLHKEQLNAYFKAFTFYYQKLINLRLKYIKLLAKSENCDVVAKHISNFLIEIGDVC